MMRGAMDRSLVTRLILFFILFSAFLLYDMSISPSRFGIYHDDALYAVASKSLASGQGYKLINLPGEPSYTKTPPMFALVLSLVWRLFPEFPGNISALIMVSVLASSAYLYFLWVYLTRCRYACQVQALLIIALTAFNPFNLKMATAVLTEMPYAVIAVVVLYAAERYERDEFSSILFGLLMGLAFLMRAAGVSLIISIAVYFFYRRRLSAVLPLSIASLFIIGWGIWTFYARNDPNTINAGYYESYSRSLSLMIADIHAGTGRSVASILLSICGKNIISILMYGIPEVMLGVSGIIVTYLGFLFVFLGAGFVRRIRQGWRLLYIYIIVYIGIHIMWPYDAYGRFLVPILPFLLLIPIGEFVHLRSVLKIAPGQRLAKSVIAIMVIILVTVVLGGYAAGDYLLALAPRKPIADMECIEWIAHNTPPDAVLIAARDPLYYLYTGRKGTCVIPKREGGTIETNRAAMDENIKKIIEENRASYLILAKDDKYYDGYQRLREAQPTTLVTVYSTENGQFEIFKIASPYH